MELAWATRWGVPTPFPVGDVNAYYLPGAVPALVDPGPRTAEAWRVLQGHLAKHPIRRVVFTHHHVDHAGLAARLQRDFGVEVAAHAVDGAVVEHWREHREERQRDYQEGLRRAGVPDAHRERMRYGGIRIEDLSESARPDFRLEDGESIRLGDREFRVVHAPGHTAGSLLLVAPDASATFAGDTLLERITPNAVSVRASERNALPNYLQTLRRLASTPLGRILPGHGRAFADAPEVIARGLRHASVRQERILRLLRGRPLSAYDLARRLFLALPDDQLFLAVSETLGHLEWLRLEGQIEVESTSAADRFGSARSTPI